MRVRLTQIIDYWIGIPLCFLVSLFERIRRIFAPLHEAVPRQILFVELSEMGSAILAYSSLVKAGKLFPGCELYFLIFEKNRESVKLLDVIPPDHIIGISDASFVEFTRDTLKAILRLRRIGIDTTIDLELFSRVTALICYLSGASNRVGFDNYTAEGLYRGSFITRRVFYNPHQPMPFNFLALVYALRENHSDRPLLKRSVRDELEPLPLFVPSREDTRTVQELLRAGNRLYATGKPLVILNPDPGEALPIRGWPKERFGEVARRLVSRVPEVFIAVIGLNCAKPYADIIRDAIGEEHFIDLTGRTATIREVVTLFTMAKVLITNDSGPAHFASLTEIECLTLFGPETPALYGPLGPHAKNFFAYLACSPCLSAHNHRHTICKENRCLQAITVDEVTAQALHQLGGSLS